ncbi:uncharacterized protein [Aegilops tauschii subsp. strangulata]|uniref:uncharacterized protein n=1 Tax=Aegilops tauschii subsp. strangulata TaxID=200361 RepID=UPI00098A9A19|nr:uncharacterized protein LOC109778725 [Aegilops tauschii subsp. strangulata]
MRGIIWNLRGFGQLDKRRQLAEAVQSEKLEFIGIQETIKSSFSNGELCSVGGDAFRWSWLPAQGHSGGILLGLKINKFDSFWIIAGQHFVSTELMQKNNRFQWELIIVYGPADHNKSVDSWWKFTKDCPGQCIPLSSEVTST